MTFYQLYLIEILHQTTTLQETVSSSVWLYLIEILHQTTTCWYESFSLLLLYLIEILHQTTTRVSCQIRRIRCILLKFYIKPQRRGRHLLNFSVLYRSSRLEKQMRKRRRSEFDVFFCISKNENTVFLEKFQLLRHIRLRPFALAPEVENVSILFIRHRQNTCKSYRRH